MMRNKSACRMRAIMSSLTRRAASVSRARSRAMPAISRARARSFATSGLCGDDMLLAFELFASELFAFELFAFEIRRALLVEGQDAFAAIFGRDHPIIRFGLHGQTVPKRHVRAAADGKLGLPHRDWRITRDGLGRRQRFGDELRSRQHLADH